MSLLYGIFRAYLRHISGISQAYFRHITGISQVNFRNISGNSQANLREILGIPEVRPANNGVSRYPSYQKIFEMAENFVEIVKIFFDFPLHLTEISNIFYQTIKTEVKRKIFFLKSHGKLYLKRWVL